MSPAYVRAPICMAALLPICMEAPAKMPLLWSNLLLGGAVAGFHVRA